MDTLDSHTRHYEDVLKSLDEHIKCVADKIKKLEKPKKKILMPAK